MVVHIRNKQVSLAVKGDALRHIEQSRQSLAVFVAFLRSAADVL
jgi:hypothetical protein